MFFNPLIVIYQTVLQITQFIVLYFISYHCILYLSILFILQKNGIIKKVILYRLTRSLGRLQGEGGLKGFRILETLEEKLLGRDSYEKRFFREKFNGYK